LIIKARICRSQTY